MAELHGQLEACLGALSVPEHERPERQSSKGSRGRSASPAGMPDGGWRRDRRPSEPLPPPSPPAVVFPGAPCTPKSISHAKRPSALALSKQGPCALSLLMADYDRCDILGRSNAAVYRAVKRGVEDMVFAAKVYSNDGSDPCRLEYELLKRLDHAVIPKVHAFYAGHRESAFVMDYAPGQNLEVLKRKGLLTVEDVLHVGERTCAALAYAHGQHVYHHDVACDNIMFDAATGKVCLLDWNYACAADYSHQTPNVSGLSPSRWTTKAGQEPDFRDTPSHESLPCSENTTSLSWEQYGKPLYRAPAGEEGRIDQQDVYALGVVLQRGLEHLDVASEVEAWLATLLAPPPARVSAQVALDSLRALRR